MTADEIEQVESYFFGVWDQTSGHYTYNRHRQGVHPSAAPGEVPSFLAATQMDQRYCRNTYKTEDEGQATLQVIEINEKPFEGQKWTILAFADRSGDKRSGSNSAFVAKGVYAFRDMLNIARIQYPSLWQRMTDKFQIQEAV